MSIRADIHGNRYKIEASGCEPDAVYMEFMGNNPGRWIAGEDAPAVALAILEAAGLGPDSTEPTVREAARDLAVYVNSRTIRAEREAEDAKADEYRKLLYWATKEGESPAMWSDYGESGKQFWRDQYRNARRFFEES